MNSHLPSHKNQVCEKRCCPIFGIFNFLGLMSEGTNHHRIAAIRRPKTERASHNQGIFLGPSLTKELETSWGTGLSTY